MRHAESCEHIHLKELPVLLRWYVEHRAAGAQPRARHEFSDRQRAPFICMSKRENLLFIGQICNRDSTVRKAHPGLFEPCRLAIDEQEISPFGSESVH